MIQDILESLPEALYDQEKFQKHRDLKRTELHSILFSLDKDDVDLLKNTKKLKKRLCSGFKVYGYKFLSVHEMCFMIEKTVTLALFVTDDPAAPISQPIFGNSSKHNPISRIGKKSSFVLDTHVRTELMSVSNLLTHRSRKATAPTRLVSVSNKTVSPCTHTFVVNWRPLYSRLLLNNPTFDFLLDSKVFTQPISVHGR